MLAAAGGARAPPCRSRRAGCRTPFRNGDDNCRARPAPVRKLTLLRSIALFEAFKALAALVAAFGLLALTRHAPLLDAASAIVGHLGLGARGTQAFHALEHAVSAERAPLLLGAAGYAALHLAEAWVSNKVRLTPAEKADRFEHFLQRKPVGTIDSRTIEVD